MVVHSQLPKYVLKDNAFSKLGITFFKGLVFVESKISHDGVDNKALFYLTQDIKEQPCSTMICSKKAISLPRR